LKLLAGDRLTASALACATQHREIVPVEKGLKSLLSYAKFA
jgi:hypothetical protein